MEYKTGLTFEQDDLRLARLGYEAYGDKAEWKNYQGLPMPTWEALPENIKTYWVAAAQAIDRDVSAGFR